jgi:hypothetical protein
MMRPGGHQVPVIEQLFQRCTTCVHDMPRLHDDLELLSADAVCLRRCIAILFASGHSVQRRQTMRIFTRCAAAMVLIAAGLFLVPAANAQAQSPSPSATDQPSNIPDQKIDAAAAAIQRVASIKQDYQQRIAAAAPDDKERILNEAIGALEKAVTDQGLSVEEYDSILTVAQNDPKVLEKIRQRLRASTD